MGPTKRTRKPAARYETRRQVAIARKKEKCACELAVPKTDIPLDFYEDISFLKSLSVVASDGVTSFRVHAEPFIYLSDIFLELWKTSKEIIFLNISSEYLNLLINFAYTLTCEISQDNLIPWLQIAKAYKISYILKLCEIFLLKEVLPKNAFKALGITRDYLCHHLVNKILTYITRNFVDIANQECVKVNLVHYLLKIINWLFFLRLCSLGG